LGIKKEVTLGTRRNYFANGAGVDRAKKNLHNGGDPFV